MSHSLKTCWRLAVLPLVVSVSACDIPSEYSPHYTTINTVSPDHPDRVKKVLVPEACLKPDDTDDNELGEHIPPGCANAHNLQRMVERESDLVEGRKLGRAPAGPSARAAQKYLNGGTEAPLGGGVSGSGSSSSGVGGGDGMAPTASAGK